MSLPKRLYYIVFLIQTQIIAFLDEIRAKSHWYVKAAISWFLHIMYSSIFFLISQPVL